MTIKAEKPNGNLKKFLDAGKNNSRVNLTHDKCLPLYDFNQVDGLKNKINEFKTYLVNLDNNIFMSKINKFFFNYS
jgi:hypothetical protein